MSNKNQNENLSERKLRAEKRVKAVKSWYGLIPFYIVGTAMMVFMTWFINPPFWMKLVFLVGPVLWWVFHFVSGVNLFLPKTNIMKTWENRQIAKFVQKQKENTSYN